MSEEDTSLADRSAEFAREVQDTLDAVLPGERKIVSVTFPEGERYVVRPEGRSVADRRIAVHVGGQHLADFGLSFFLDLDRSGHYLKTVRSELVLHSVLDRTPLTRLDYRADMQSAPIAHWQMHAERGAFSHLLAHGHREGRVERPHDLSSLHFPVGGERFRPCLEDFLQFLVRECGADHHPGWESYVSAGRRRWRLRQLGAAVRDAPEEAARVLRETGWTVLAPEDAAGTEGKFDSLIRW